MKCRRFRCSKCHNTTDFSVELKYTGKGKIYKGEIVPDLPLDLDCRADVITCKKCKHSWFPRGRK